MKKLLFVFYLLPFICKGQDTLAVPKIPYDTASKSYSYRIIEEAPGLNKNDLFYRAHEWAALNFNSANNVIQMDDKDNGKIIIRGSYKSNYEYRMILKYNYVYYLKFVIAITVKDSKYRVVISDFSTQSSYNELYSNFYKSIQNKIIDVNEYNYQKKAGNENPNITTGEAKFDLQFLNDIHVFATVTLDEIKKVLSKPAKADDF
ncbi:DUF4468 domain-containing protein [Mucilaginibacter sp.]|uniref:DUF4468 domain-containing protein n=1 Tax=Mucilaginibacter sp. TaxID=1882438 RepID=UPI0026217971|nr:DUF4468 domain-containing protein [Mucilaginibacter sp.]MDB4922265.1 hypothetical protein [Mucilaginibacter sp.]